VRARWIREQFKKKEFNYLFVVDIFNEGVDIPEIDTVLFLRPTESLTVFFFNNWDVDYVCQKEKIV
jgi:superfamily II DNA or RNA helicase